MTAFEFLLGAMLLITFVGALVVWVHDRVWGNE